MNKQLVFQYRNLGKTDKESLNHKFNDSDKMTRLVGFLASLKGDDFPTHKAIETIYEEELDKTDQEILTNRFYKLRKKLTETINSLTNHSAESFLPLPIPEEEAEFLKCRQLINVNDISGAVKKLKNLLKKCEELEIYELLPDICNQIIYCNQVMNLHQLNGELMEKAFDYIKRNQSLQKQKILLRRAQHEYMTDGFAAANSTLKEIKYESDQFSSERLRMNYHWGSLIIGTSSFANSPHALSRHLKHIESYIAKNPDKPFLNYTYGHQWNDRFHLNLIKGSFGFLLNDFEMCYDSFKDCFAMIERIPSLQSRRSEPLFLNKIFIDLITKRYDEAIGTLNELEKFIRSQKLKERLGMIWVQRLRIYLFSYPQLRSKDHKNEIKNTLEFIKVLKSQGQKNFIDEYQLWLSLYYFIHKEYNLAKKYFNSENVSGLLKIRKADKPEIARFIKDPHSFSPEEIKILTGTIYTLINAEKNIENKMYYEVIGRIADSFRSSSGKK